jgi:hypothetical protein
LVTLAKYPLKRKGIADPNFQKRKKSIMMATFGQIMTPISEVILTISMMSPNTMRASNIRAVTKPGTVKVAW